MKATETKFQDFLASNKTQFIIPVYQRNYDWTILECKQILDDIIHVGSKDNMNAHFIGSVVYIHDDVYTSSRIKELTIIDGQQRITTITLIYIVLKRLAKELNNQKLADEINETYLTNKFVSDSEKLKLHMTENNEHALKYLLREENSEQYLGRSKLIDNFNYFIKRINRENYQFVLSGLEKLIFVEISLDRNKDNPQKIFESLNSTGLRLSEADLIRNYILMGLNHADQTKIYQNYWEIIESHAKDEIKNSSKVSDFIRDYLTLENKEIPRKTDVYKQYKLKHPFTDTPALEKELEKLKNLVKYYNKLINPKNEDDRDIRLQLEYIARLEINVAYPFLMKVYEDYGNGLIDKSVFISILNLIQSFTWRRFVVSLPTNSLNKIFMTLYEKIDTTNYLSSLEDALMKFKGNNRFPTNTEIKNALREKDFYNIQSKNRVYLLERLENYENREPVEIENNSYITVEHIFPQNPDPKWRIELGQEEFSFVKDNYINTIANLTLSGNNGKLGNRSFIEKRDMPEAGYRDSRLWLNKYLSSLNKWGRNEIETRFTYMIERFLKIWAFPENIVVDDANSEEVNIFEAEDPRSKKLEYAIFFDQKIEVREVTKLYIYIFKTLYELEPDAFFTTSLSEKIYLTKNPNDPNLRQPAAINDTYFIETNLDNNSKFDRIKYALKVFNFEDELFIKYKIPD